MLDNLTIALTRRTAPIIARVIPGSGPSCKGTVWVPFRMLRDRIPMLSAMTSTSSVPRCVVINAASGPLLTKFGAVIEVLG
jgi:hypothetical protein